MYPALDPMRAPGKVSWVYGIPPRVPISAFASPLLSSSAALFTPPSLPALSGDSSQNSSAKKGVGQRSDSRNASERTKPGRSCFQGGQLKTFQAESLTLEGREGAYELQARPCKVSLPCHCDKKIYFPPPSPSPIAALSLRNLL